MVRWPDGGESKAVRDALEHPYARLDPTTGEMVSTAPITPIDQSWSLTVRDTLLGWARIGADWCAVEVSWDGQVRRLGQGFARLMFAGPVALGGSGGRVDVGNDRPRGPLDTGRRDRTTARAMGWNGP